MGQRPNHAMTASLFKPKNKVDGLSDYTEVKTLDVQEEQGA